MQNFYKFFSCFKFFSYKNAINSHKSMNILSVKEYRTRGFSSKQEITKDENVSKETNYMSNEMNNQKKEKVIIVGAGVIGITTAYALSKISRYDILVIDRHEEIAQETSYCNGALFCPSLCFPWINEKMIQHIWPALTDETYPIQISSSTLKEKNLPAWLINAISNLNKDKVSINMEKIFSLGQLSNQQLKELEKSISSSRVMKTSKGTIQLYRDNTNIKTAREFKEKWENKGLTMEILDEEQLYVLEPALSKGKIRYKYGIYYPLDSNLDSFETSKAIAKLAIENGVKIMTNTEFISFGFDNDNNKKKFRNILTSKGEIPCDKIVVASGNSSKIIMEQLGIKIPLLPIKGYTLTIDIPNDYISPNYNLCDDESKIYLTKLGKKYRISGNAEFRGYDFKIYHERINLLLNGAMNKIGQLNSDSMTLWTGCRPVSPDDVPIIGRLKQYDNIYINTGHGSKGLTLSFGSAKLLSDIMIGKSSDLNENDYSLDRFSLI